MIDTMGYFQTHAVNRCHTYSNLLGSGNLQPRPALTTSWFELHNVLPKVNVPC